MIDAEYAILDDVDGFNTIRFYVTVKWRLGDFVFFCGWDHSDSAICFPYNGSLAGVTLADLDRDPGRFRDRIALLSELRDDIVYGTSKWKFMEFSGVYDGDNAIIDDLYLVVRDELDLLLNYGVAS